MGKSDSLGPAKIRATTGSSPVGACSAAECRRLAPSGSLSASDAALSATDAGISATAGDISVAKPEGVDGKLMVGNMDKKHVLKPGRHPEICRVDQKKRAFHRQTQTRARVALKSSSAQATLHEFALAR